MGGREVGGLANLLSGHRNLANAQHRAEVARLWQLKDVPAKPGKTAVEMFEAAADGEIKALWIACTNPAHSMPKQSTVRRALERAEFVMVQEAFGSTSTCEFADLLLPATSWGEKEGTVTNSERCISRVRAAVPAPGQARHDWQIVVDIARALEAQHGLLTGRTTASTLFPYESAESIWLEHRASTQGRDLDITGLSYQLLESSPQQWPFPANAKQGQKRLYADGRFATDSGKARFYAQPCLPTAEQRQARYPFSLTTGRLRDQWHGMSRTGLLGRLFGHVSEPVVQVNQQDLERHQWREGDLLQITSARGSIVAPVQASSELAPNQVFMAMHWGPEFLSGRHSSGHLLAGVNTLTTSEFCAQSKQPELKHSAVKLVKAEMPWRLLAAAWLPLNEWIKARQQLRSLFGSFDFVSCVPFGQEAMDFQSAAPQLDAPDELKGILFRAACHQAPEAQSAENEAIASLIQCLGLNNKQTLAYQDQRRQQQRAVRLLDAQKPALGLQGFLMAGDIRSEAWMLPLLQNKTSVQGWGKRLLMPVSNPPAPVTAVSKIICSCVGVQEQAIKNCLRSLDGQIADPMAALQSQLRCGTQCGSCLPEIRGLLASHTPAPA